MKNLSSDAKSLYFIQSAYTVYPCVSMAIYLSYFLLEVVMLIRISILNYEQDFSITLRDSKIVLQREGLTLAGLERWWR